MHFSPFTSLAFLNLGPWEIGLILFLALLLFGGKKLPGLAKDLGQGIREFRRSISGSPDEETPPSPSKESTPRFVEDDTYEEESEIRPKVAKAVAKKTASQKAKAKKKKKA